MRTLLVFPGNTPQTQKKKTPSTRESAILVCLGGFQVNSLAFHQRKASATFGGSRSPSLVGSVLWGLRMPMALVVLVVSAISMNLLRLTFPRAKLRRQIFMTRAEVWAKNWAKFSAHFRASFAVQNDPQIFSQNSSQFITPCLVAENMKFHLRELLGFGGDIDESSAQTRLLG